MSFNGPAFGAAQELINGVATGLQSTKQNADGTVTVTYKDGNSYTTPNIKGQKGDKGDTGEKGEPGEAGRTPTTEEITPIVENVFESHKSELVTPQQLEDAIGGALNGTY